MDENNDQRSNTPHVQQSCSKTSVVSTDIEQLKFFSGNPHVESTTGILHFCKNKTALDSMGEECCTVCMVEIPAHFSCFELLRFIAPVGDKIIESKIIRDDSPNQYFVVIKFKSFTDAFGFYQEYNGSTFVEFVNQYRKL